MKLNIIIPFGPRRILKVPAPSQFQKGGRSEYLAMLAGCFPERDANGFVMGYSVYSAERRELGPFPSEEIAEQYAAEFGWLVVPEVVATAKQRILWDPRA